MLRQSHREVSLLLLARHSCTKNFVSFLYYFHLWDFCLKPIINGSECLFFCGAHCEKWHLKKIQLHHRFPNSVSPLLWIKTCDVGQFVWQSVVPMKTACSVNYPQRTEDLWLKRWATEKVTKYIYSRSLSEQDFLYFTWVFLFLLFISTPNHLQESSDRSGSFTD